MKTVSLSAKDFGCRIASSNGWGVVRLIGGTVNQQPHQQRPTGLRPSVLENLLQAGRSAGLNHLKQEAWYLGRGPNGFRSVSDLYIVAGICVSLNAQKIQLFVAWQMFSHPGPAINRERLLQKIYSSLSFLLPGVCIVIYWVLTANLCWGLGRLK